LVKKNHKAGGGNERGISARENLGQRERRKRMKTTTLWSGGRRNHKKGFIPPVRKKRKNPFLR